MGKGIAFLNTKRFNPTNLSNQKILWEKQEQEKSDKVKEAERQATWEKEQEEWKQMKLLDKDNKINRSELDFMYRGNAAQEQTEEPKTEIDDEAPPRDRFAFLEEIEQEKVAAIEYNKLLVERKAQMLKLQEEEKNTVYYFEEVSENNKKEKEKSKKPARRSRSKSPKRSHKNRSPSPKRRNRSRSPKRSYRNRSRSPVRTHRSRNRSPSPKRRNRSRSPKRHHSSHSSRKSVGPEPITDPRKYDLAEDDELEGPVTDRKGYIESIKQAPKEDNFIVKPYELQADPNDPNQVMLIDEEEEKNSKKPKDEGSSLDEDEQFILGLSDKERSQLLKYLKKENKSKKKSKKRKKEKSSRKRK